MPETAKRVDPFISCKFHVQIDNIEQASFTECSGLQVETEVYEYQEGGFNEYVHKLPGRSKVSNVTLKRGVTDSNELWEWYQNIVRGDIKRKNVSVVLYDQAGSEVMRWTFVGAYPVKWVGPTFKSDDNTVAIETLELAHQGIELD
jgi:phage tail-like protein